MDQAHDGAHEGEGTARIMVSRSEVDLPPGGLGCARTLR